MTDEYHTHLDMCTVCSLPLYLVHRRVGTAHYLCHTEEEE